MTDREALIRTYVQRQKDLAEIQERFKNRKSAMINFSREVAAGGEEKEL